MHYIVILAVVINSIGGISYIIKTLKGDVKPNKVTWLIWGLAPLIGATAEIYHGVTWAVLPVFMAGFIPFLIFISSFLNKKSYWKLGKIDYYCLVLSIIAIILWLSTGNPLLAIIFSIIADVIASIPTIIKTYKFPETESVLIFITFLFSSLSAFLVIENWTPEEYLFPLYLTILCSTLIICFYRKEILKIKKLYFF